MSELSNGKLLKEIHDMVIRLDEWRGTVDKRLNSITDVFKPDGICSKARSSMSNIKVQVGIQWVILFALLVYLVLRQVS